MNTEEQRAAKEVMEAYERLRMPKEFWARPDVMDLTSAVYLLRRVCQQDSGERRTRKQKNKMTNPVL